MKIRLGFVTNSSSTAYVIRNKTDKKLTAADFAKDVYPLLDDDEKEDMTLEDAIATAEESNFDFPPNKMIVTIVYDERPGVWGLIRGEGESKRFQWTEYSE